MNLDPQFVRDLTVLISASAGAGLLMAALGQPPINGYFVAGSLVGPGGLKLIKEIVQVGVGGRTGGWVAGGSLWGSVGSVHVGVWGR